jgi:type I restriction enzyme, R subunit
LLTYWSRVPTNQCRGADAWSPTLRNVLAIEADGYAADMDSWGPTEYDTCRDYVLPAIEAAGWNSSSVHEQYPVLGDMAVDSLVTRVPSKRRADYVLEIVPGQPLVVIEAKRLWADPADGIQQATRYATKLDVPFAISTNGNGWVLYNGVTGLQSEIDTLPTPEEAWDLFTESHDLNSEGKDLVLSSFNSELRNPDGSARVLRYYQRRAIHETLVALSKGRKRALLVMATGTGKTFTAMQLAWKLVNHRQNLIREGHASRNYRILYLADRKKLVDDPLNKTFRPVFGESVIRVKGAEARHSRDIYFSTYQALDTAVPSDPDYDVTDSDNVSEAQELLHNYPSDFFDLVIVDECHRGSARADSAWRAMLDHFSDAAQLGLTATPVNHGGADTFEYFGNPVFEYSLRQGIQDGFLAPYTIRRAIFNVDAEGITVDEGDVDHGGRLLPAGTYTTRDFERRLRLPERTREMARHIDRIVSGTADRAIVFCVDGTHAATLAAELRNLRPVKTASNPEWVSRIMTAERDKDRLLDEFTEPENDTPQIAVTTKLLSTGVDVPDLKYVILARYVGSVAEFKQIIGRGTRLYLEKDKTDFEIIDYVGATTLFSDEEFDGPPLKPILTVVVGAPGDDASIIEDPAAEGLSPEAGLDRGELANADVRPLGREPGSAAVAAVQRREVFELRGVEVELSSEGFWIHDIESGAHRLVKYVDWTKERILESFAGPNDLLSAWADPEGRAGVVAFLERNKVDPARLAAELNIMSGSPVDTVDQLLNLAWGVVPLTRAERASRAKQEHQEELEAMSALARRILETMIDHYSVAGIDEISRQAIVRVPPLSLVASPHEIAEEFGGANNWHQARIAVQTWLYDVS